MSLFSKIDMEIIKDLTRMLERSLSEIRECKMAGRKPILALTIENQILMNTTLTLGTPFVSGLTLIDNVTLQPVVATFANQTISTDAPSVATFAYDTVIPTQVNATPLAVGTGNIILSADATYVNSKGVTITQSLSAIYAFSVVVGPDSVTLSLTDFVPAGSTTTTSTTTV